MYLAQQTRRAGALLGSLVLATVGLSAGLAAPAAAIEDPDAMVSSPPASSVLPETSECIVEGGVGEIGGENAKAEDSNVSVYVGGDFVREAGSELEGRLVVNGNARISSSGGYDIGWAGGGSGLVPTPTVPGLLVGGDLLVGATTRVHTNDNGTQSNLEVRAGGQVTGESFISSAADGLVRAHLGREVALGSPVFSQWPANDFAILRDLAQRAEVGTVPGTVEIDAWTITLRPASGADRHLFEIPASALTGTNNRALYVDPSIIGDATVIRVTGDGAINMKLDSVFVVGDAQQLDMGDPRFGQLSQSVLWDFPSASEVTLGGYAQYPGSMIVQNPASVTTLAAPGTNGRIWVAGDLVQNFAGSEFHSFPLPWVPEMNCKDPSEPTDPEEPTDPSEPTDPEEPQVGGFNLAKLVNAPDMEACGLNSTSTFDVVATWSGPELAGSAILSLPIDGTSVSGPQDLPYGTHVSFAEAPVQNTETCALESASFSKSALVIGENTNNTVALTNTFRLTEPAPEPEVDLGTFTLTKLLSGIDVSDFEAGTTFTVEAAWELPDGTPGQQTFLLPVEGTVVAGPELPVGTVVTVTEVLPEDLPAFTWVENIISHSQFTIAEDETVAVTVTNVYEADTVRPPLPEEPEGETPPGEGGETPPGEDGETPPGEEKPAPEDPEDGDVSDPKPSQKPESSDTLPKTGATVTTVAIAGLGALAAGAWLLTRRKVQS